MLRTFVAFIVSAATLASLSTAQDPPFRATLRCSFDRVGVTFADVWADGDTALMAYFGTNKVEFVDITDPDNCASLLVYNVPAPNNGVSAQEIKGANGLLFIALGGAGTDSVEIVDIRDPSTPTPLTIVRIAGFSAPHNIFIDSGWLYLCKGAGDGIAIVDLTAYDPDSPPALITTPKWTVTGAGSVHDITVTGDRMWVSDISGSQRVYDVSSNATQSPVFLGSIRGGSVHSSWPTADHAFLVTADESFAGPIRLLEVVDGGGTVELIQRDSWVSPLTGLGSSGNPHNPLVFGDRVYVANNAGGVLCLQIDRTTKTWEKVAAFDTSTIVPAGATGEGCWGVYPFLGTDKILASDRQTGLHVLDFSALEIAFAAAPPCTIPATQTVFLDVTIDELGTISLDPSTVTLHHSTNGAPFQQTAMTSTGGNGWRAAFPVLQCRDRLDYYVTATSLGGDEFSRPGLAPEELYTTYGASGMATVFADDFETDKGWIIQTSPLNTAGAFERGVPVDNRYQPPFDDPDSVGTMCYVTEIGTGGNDDVDGGRVGIESPVMDFAGKDGLISYVRWYYNNDADGAQGEPFLVELSSDGGASWTIVDSITLAAGGWKRHCFRITDFLAPTSQMKVRFSASDQPNDSLVEAGVDSFLAESFGCALPTASAAFRNGTGVNPACYTSVTAPVLGQSWITEIDHSGRPGATLTQIHLYQGAATGPVFSFGEVLVDFGSQRFFVDSRAISASPNVHQNAIPFDASFAGIFSATQAVILGGGVGLCNANDVVIGF